MQDLTRDARHIMVHMVKISNHDATVRGKAKTPFPLKKAFSATGGSSFNAKNPTSSHRIATIATLELLPRQQKLAVFFWSS